MKNKKIIITLLLSIAFVFIGYVTLTSMGYSIKIVKTNENPPVETEIPDTPPALSDMPSVFPTETPPSEIQPTPDTSAELEVSPEPEVTPELEVTPEPEASPAPEITPEPDITPTPEELPTSEPASELTITLDELRNQDIIYPAEITTAGYHFYGDGGNAKYVITNDSSLTPNNSTVIELKNGYKALLVIENGTITPEQFGAYGDGLHDDVNALQAALDSGFTVSMNSNHTYLLSTNGLFFRTNINLLGNGATLLINDTYHPANQDAFGKRILRNYLCDCQTLSITSLNIDVDMSDGKYINDYLVVFQPTYFENVCLTDVNINISRSYNRITAFWMDHGCDNLVLSNCSFINNTTYANGGIFFLLSNDDTKYQKYNSFKNVSINDCEFSGSCGDEAIAIWGPNSQNVSITNTDVNWVRESSGYNRPVAIYSDKDTHATYNVAFQNCNFVCANVDGIADNECDSFIGVGSSYAGNQFNVTFNKCDIQAKVKGSLIYPSCIQKDASHIGDFDLCNPSIHLNFKDSTINCNMPITGNNASFIQGARTVKATDCSFDGCNIKCKYAFAYTECYSNSKNYYIPTINLNNNTITVEQPVAFIYQTNNSAKINGTLQNTTITGNGLSKLNTLKYNTTLKNAIPTQSNAGSSSFSIDNVSIN